MNPLHWKREYQIAWIAFCLIGGMAGLFIAWMDSTGRKLAISNTLDLGTQAWFYAWLADPSQYWQWPLFGAAFVGLTFYAVMLVVVRSK
jgi:hypothetical protein